MPKPPKDMEIKSKPLIKSTGRRRLLSNNYRNKTMLNENQRHRIYNNVSRQRDNINKNNIVVNLSSRKLSLLEISTLNKGLNFCVSTNGKTSINKDIDNDLKKFTRTLQLRFLFNNHSLKEVEKFTGNPTWNPPKSKCSPEINGFTDYLQQEIKKLIVVNKTKHNISREERNALEILSKDKNILIQKADKGGSIVVLNTIDYEDKMKTMLSDAVTYTEIPCINLIEAKTQIDKIIGQLFNFDYISKKQNKFLTRCTPKIPILYGLPKIHKKNWPLRPIVSQINSPAYQLNKYLDYLLTTAEKCIPNLLQDTTKFLQIIHTLQPLSDNCILFTIDVTSLYTVLPHELVINYVEEMYSETLLNWNKYTPDIKPIPGSLIKEIIKIILNQTFFSFNNKTYLQNYGITMGAPSSVKLANIALYKHLDKILKNYAHLQPRLSLRLIDDIFGIWGGTETELLAWVKYLNDSHHSIKFTLEFSKIEIPFLDTLVYIEQNKVKTKLYKKPTDNKQYLHFNSEHPQHVKTAIPYAQALRYRRIIEDDGIFKIELEKLKSSFLSRLYPEKVVDAAIDRVSNLNRLDIIKYKNKQVEEWTNIPFVITFNNAFVSNKNCNIYKLLSESWEEFIKMTPVLNNMFAPKIVFKKCNTINNVLVSTKFPPPRWSQLATTPRPHAMPITQINQSVVSFAKPCRKPRCNTCSMVVADSHFNSTVFNKMFDLTENLDCSSENIIYLITCSKCNIQYVGETGNALRVRMNAHRYCVKSNKDTPVGIHFNSKNHNASHLKIMPIEKLQTTSISDRRAREFFWQLRLGTGFPKGLNNFPVENRLLFLNLNIESFVDLELFWALKCMEESSDDDLSF